MTAALGLRGLWRRSADPSRPRPDPGVRHWPHQGRRGRARLAGAGPAAPDARRLHGRQGGRQPVRRTARPWPRPGDAGGADRERHLSASAHHHGHRRDPAWPGPRPSAARSGPDRGRRGRAGCARGSHGWPSAPAIRRSPRARPNSRDPGPSRRLAGDRVRRRFQGRRLRLSWAKQERLGQRSAAGGKRCAWCSSSPRRVAAVSAGSARTADGGGVERLCQRLRAGAQRGATRARLEALLGDAAGRRAGRARRAAGGRPPADADRSPGPGTLPGHRHRPHPSGQCPGARRHARGPSRRNQLSDSMRMFRLGPGGRQDNGTGPACAGMVLQGRRQHRRRARPGTCRCRASRWMAARRPRSPPSI